jgi:hypothetical protein
MPCICLNSVKVYTGNTTVYPKYSAVQIIKINKRVWKLPTSTQLRACWHIGSLDIVFLLSTGASRYHNCCMDGGTSPEYFGYPSYWFFYLDKRFSLIKQSVGFCFSVFVANTVQEFCLTLPTVLPYDKCVSLWDHHTDPVCVCACVCARVCCVRLCACARVCVRVRARGACACMCVCKRVANFHKKTCNFLGNCDTMSSNPIRRSQNMVPTSTITNQVDHKK